MAKKKEATSAEGTSAGQAAEQDPSPSVDHIDKLAGRILRGDILLPKFQRDMVWNKKKIIDLLDSIAKGFPIGSVLLWQTEKRLSSTRSIADLDITPPAAKYPVNYLLDGQQRLSVICGALYWHGDDPKSKWNLAYDLRAQKFVHLETLDEPPLHQIRLNKYPDAASYFSQIFGISNSSLLDKKELEERAKKLFNRLKDYKIATVTLQEMDIRAVAPIFERINKGATVLTIVDLMRAATWDVEFDLIDSIQGILDGLKAKGFHLIEHKYLLRSLSAAAGGGFAKGDIDVLRYKEDVLRYQEEDASRQEEVERLKTIVEDTKAGYKRMVDFLTTQFRVSSSAAVPYANQMIVLAEIFRRLPRPTAAQFDAIKEWFWRTTLSGYFAGWNNAQMASDISAVKAFSAGHTSSLPGDMAIPNSDIWITGKFGSTTAHSKLLSLLLSQHQPLDLLTGQEIDSKNALAWANIKEFHHFFPRDFLKKRNVAKDRINVLANFVMLTSASNKTISGRAPSDYLKDVSSAAGSNLQSWLDSNLISSEAYRAALADDYEGFLRHRSETIHRTALVKARWQTHGAQAV